MAWLGVRWQIALPEMALSLGYSWIERRDGRRQAGALRPAGRPAADFTSLRPRAAEMPRALAAPDGDIGSATPLAAIASARHETQYSRLFRS
jgi:urease accessory protein